MGRGVLASGSCCGGRSGGTLTALEIGGFSVAPNRTVCGRLSSAIY